MTTEQRDKYAYELMVKNNQEEVVKQLLLKDKKLKELEEENKKLKSKIEKAIEYIKKETYYNDIEGCCYELDYTKCEELLEIVKGEENESN